MNELKDVPGFDRYVVDERGIVYSMKGDVPRALKQRMHKGYWHVLIKTKLGRINQHKVPVHRIVLMAFKGAPKHKDFMGRHLDGDRDNNVPSNLEWGTARQNIHDAIRHGTHVSVTKVTKGRSRVPKGV